MKTIINCLDKFTDFTGRSVAWLTLVMVLVTAIVVICRKLFDWKLVGLQESITYMHAVVFMLAAAWTLQRGGHVRVDIFYRRYSPKTQAWIDALGGLLFTLPFMLFIGIGSWDFVCESWRIKESSTDSGGLPLIYLLKSLLPLMAFGVCVQALADVLRNTLFLMIQPIESES